MSRWSPAIEPNCGESRIKYCTTRKEKHFSIDQIREFLLEAPDPKYSAMKAVTVFVICGAVQTNEVTSVRVDMVEDYGVEIFLRIPDSRTKVATLHSISGKYPEIVRKYLMLRPVATKTYRFFLQYQDGKYRCAIGKKTLAGIPRKIAEFLKLPGREEYNGLSLPATTLADTGDKRAIVDIFSNDISSGTSSSDTSVNNAMDSIVGDLGIKQEDEQAFVAEDYAFNDTYNDIHVNTEDETSQVDDSNFDQDVIKYEDCKNDKEIIRNNNCTLPMNRRNQFEIVYVNGNGEHSSNIDFHNNLSSESAGHQNILLYHSKIKDQAEEIVRLKKLNDKRNLEIEILKDLLQESMKRNLRNEVLSENANNSNTANLGDHNSCTPAKVMKLATHLL